MFYLIILLLFPLANSISYHSTMISISRGASFMNYFTTLETETITECSMKYLWKNKTYAYKINMNAQQDFGSDEIQTKFRNIGRNTCGIHMINVTECPEQLIFNITYLDGDQNTQKFDGFFGVILLDIVLGPHEPELAKLGEKLSLRCDGAVHQWNLVNPEGTTVFSVQKPNLKYDISRATMKDIGQWTCVPLMKNVMEVTTRPFTVSVTDAVYESEGWYREEGGYGIIGCRTDMPIQQLKFCMFETPEKNVHTIGSTSVASVRYTTLGTDLGNSICQIEFKLPIREEERGQWKCSIGEITGTYITTDSTKRAVYKKSYDIISAVNQTNVLITCPIPYRMDSCVIQDPSNTVYTYYTREKYRLGECSHTITLLQAKHIGLWKCMMSSLTRSEDEVIEVVVRTYETLSAVYKDIEADEGDEINLRCSSASALILCQFIDPSGRIYTMSPQKKVDDFKYLGKGLNYGDCGMTIMSLSKRMSGTWSCRVMTSWNMPSKFMTDTIRINVNEAVGPAIGASAIGIFIGIGAALILVVTGALIARYRSKRRKEANLVSTRSSQTDHGSNESLATRHSISSGSSVDIPIGSGSVAASMVSAIGNAVSSVRSSTAASIRSSAAASIRSSVAASVRSSVGTSNRGSTVASTRGSTREADEIVMSEMQGNDMLERQEEGLVDSMVT